MKITWLGHACFCIESDSATVVFDPYAPGKVPGLELPPLSADLVISSHEHSDHFYPPAVKQLRRRVNVLTTGIKTFHDDVRGEKRGLNTITVLEMDGLRIAHLGDLGHLLSEEQLKSIGRPDVLLLPIGGYYTIDFRQAREIADKLQSFITIPMHYRGEGFGYDVLSTVDEFAALSPDAVFWDSNVLELNEVDKSSTIILKCPVK